MLSVAEQFLEQQMHPTVIICAYRQALDDIITYAKETVRYVCMYLCMYVFMYVCMQVLIYVFINYMYVCIYVYACKYLSTCTYV